MSRAWRTGILLLAVVGIAAPALGQSRLDGLRRAGRRGASSARPAPPTAFPRDPLPAGAMESRADHVERDGPHVVLLGYAQIAYEDAWVQADRIELREDTLRVEAWGNVVFERGDRKINAESASADLRNRRATFRKARGLLGADFYFLADTLEDRGGGEYVIENGKFTNCAQPNPRWHFSASRTTVRPNRYAYMRSVTFRLKSVPVLYSPFLAYPLVSRPTRDDSGGRRTGFLMPRYGRSERRGHEVTQAFFWAISRNMDYTLAMDYYSIAGTRFENEFRYVGRNQSRANVLASVFNDKLSESRDFALRYDLNQRLPFDFRFSGRGETSSSFDFSRQFEDSFEDATRRSNRVRFDLKGKALGHSIRVEADRRDTRYPGRNQVRQKLPQISVTRRNFNLLGQYMQVGYDANYVRVGRSRDDDVLSWDRVFVGPKIGFSIPSVSFLELSADVDAGWLRYGGSEDPETGEFDPGRNLTRRFYGTSVSAVGPTFERVFSTPGGFYAGAWKHVIEPEIDWRYVRGDDNFDLIRKFDRHDNTPSTNEINVGIVNRLLARRIRDGTEESSPTDVITWRIFQSFFFDPEAGAYSGRFNSSSFSSESTVEKSPIRSDFRFTPDPALNGDWTMEWDPDDRLFRSVRAGLRFGQRSSFGRSDSDARRTSFSANFSRRARRGRAEDPDSLGPVEANSFVTAQAEYSRQILRTALNVNYDITDRELSNLRLQVSVLFQCCGVNAQWIRYGLSDRQENLFQFGITLGGLTSFGFGLGGSERGGRYY